jgi:heme/copper-type cytochrome/quinol oxidase subunit 3
MTAPGSSVPAVPGHAGRQPRVKSNGWWGVVLLICTESSLFGTLIATYFYLEFTNPSWPPPGTPRPELTVPLVLTGVLVLTSIPMQLASRAAIADRLRPARWWLLLAVFVQSGYISMQMVQFMDDLAKWSTNTAYGSIYYVLLGADHAHVYVGILLIFALLLKLARGLTSYRAKGVQAVALYWHFVNVLTVFVTFTTLAPSL